MEGAAAGPGAGMAAEGAVAGAGVPDVAGGLHIPFIHCGPNYGRQSRRHNDLLEYKYDGVPEEVSQTYYVTRTIGKGSFGLVKLVFEKKTCDKFAMKILKKKFNTNGQQNWRTKRLIKNEVKIAKLLYHPFITTAVKIFDLRYAVYIVMEYMENGTLLQRVHYRKRLSERDFKIIFMQMVHALKYMHSLGVAHRDLKPDNVLLRGQGIYTIAKIADFGVSKVVGRDRMMRTRCGTKMFMAPEMLTVHEERLYGLEADIWSLGVISFFWFPADSAPSTTRHPLQSGLSVIPSRQMFSRHFIHQITSYGYDCGGLSGHTPFTNHFTTVPLDWQISLAWYQFMERHWKYVSFNAMILIRRMLSVQSNRRITLNEILEDVWMQDAMIIAHVDVLFKQSANSMVAVSGNKWHNKPGVFHQHNPNQ